MHGCWLDHSIFLHMERYRLDQQSNKLCYSLTLNSYNETVNLDCVFHGNIPAGDAFDTVCTRNNITWSISRN